MSPFLRKVRTRSGAVAVQIVEKKGGQRRIVEHVGSAHSEAELAALMHLGWSKLHAGQDELDLYGSSGAGRPCSGGAVVESSASRLLVDAVRGVWDFLGFDCVGDEAFFQLVLARLVEPTSKLDSVRVLNELGVNTVHLSTLKRALKRCAGRDYRSLIAGACFAHATRGGDISLLLYDVTTLYFEAEKEDELRKVGYSKERRVDPQIVVGLLVDRHGFPLEIGMFEGNKAETHTLLPTIRAFQQRHNLADMVIVADAGMLSASNLQALDEAGLRFIVGSKITKAPVDLASHFHWHGDTFTDGQIIDTITPRRASMKNSTSHPADKAEPVWNRHTHSHSWRAIWAYSAKRAVRDAKTLTTQENRARAVIAGEKTSRTPRFVTIKHGDKHLDEASLQRARQLIGLKGYVTNIPNTIMTPDEIIASYHDLWHVEQSFRMSKTDLKARPIFHHTQEAIDAHLTIVFTALAIARHMQNTTGMSIKKIVHTLKPLRHVTIRIGQHHLEAQPTIPNHATDLLNTLGH